MKRALLVTTVTAGLAAGGMLAANADWASPTSQSTASSRAATMPAGAVPRVSPAGTKVVISWDGQQIAGRTMQSYLVTAHGVKSKPRTRTVTALSATFGAEELAGDTWQWTITARFGSWTGPAGPPSRRLTFPGTVNTAEQAAAPTDQPVVRVTPPEPQPPEATKKEESTPVSPAPASPSAKVVEEEKQEQAEPVPPPAGVPSSEPASAGAAS